MFSTIVSSLVFTGRRSVWSKPKAFSRVNNLSGYNNDPEVTFLQFIYSVHSVDVIN